MSTTEFSGPRSTVRRSFWGMSTCVMIVAGLAAIPGAPSSYAEGPESEAARKQSGSSGSRRPNLLILMADHLRGDTTDPESQCLTPNMDRLAAEGVRFTRCYTPNGMCSPARASLMTGTYPSTHGVWDCTHTQRPEWLDVSPKFAHWAERLSTAGYHTGYYGKWHVTQSQRLEDYGWAEYEIKESTTYRGAGTIPGTKVISRKEGYRDSVRASVRRDEERPPHHPAYDRAIDFIGRHASSDEPFCCFVSTTEPG